MGKELIELDDTMREFRDKYCGGDKDELYKMDTLAAISLLNIDSPNGEVCTGGDNNDGTGFNK